MRVYSFVTAQGAITTFEADVMHFFRHLTSRYGFPAHTQNMLSEYSRAFVSATKVLTFVCFTVYQFGTEPFYGSKTRFTVSHFEANVY